MGITLNGFENLMKDFKAIPQELDRASDKSVARAAHLLRGHVIKTIDSQPSDWAELDPDYLASKIKEGGNPKKLISGVRRGGSHVSGHYRNSFEVQELINN